MRFMITLVLTLFTLILTAPPNNSIYIASGEELRDQRLLKAILQIETDNDPIAVNWRELSHGALQIRPCFVVEVNRILKIQGSNERFTIVDALDPAKSIKMFWIVQKYWNPTGDIYRGCKIHNGWGKSDYYEKVKRLI